MGAISELHSFNTLALRPSGPGALCTLSPFNSLRIPLGSTCDFTHGGEWAGAFGGDFRVSFAIFFFFFFFFFWSGIWVTGTEVFW